MANFWEKIGNAAAAVGFVEKVDSPAPAAEVAVATVPQGVTLTTRPSAPAPSPVDQDRLRAIDESSRNLLITAMQNDGAPLVEEVSDTLETLQEAVADERIRYITAIKMLVKRGHGVTSILSDFDKCLGVLEENKRSFETDSKAQFDAKVGAKARSVESLTAQIEGKNQQLLALKQDIAAITAKRDEEQAGISGEQAKIAQVQDRFTIVYNAIRSSVEAQRTKISQHGEGL